MTEVGGGEDRVSAGSMRTAGHGHAQGLARAVDRVTDRLAIAQSTVARIGSTIPRDPGHGSIPEPVNHRAVLIEMKLVQVESMIPVGLETLLSGVPGSPQTRRVGVAMEVGRSRQPGFGMRCS